MPSTPDGGCKKLWQGKWPQQPTPKRAGLVSARINYAYHYIGETISANRYDTFPGKTLRDVKFQRVRFELSCQDLTSPIQRL